MHSHPFKMKRRGKEKKTRRNLSKKARKYRKIKKWINSYKEDN